MTDTRHVALDPGSSSLKRLRRTAAGEERVWPDPSGRGRTPRGLCPAGGPRELVAWATAELGSRPEGLALVAPDAPTAAAWREELAPATAELLGGGAAVTVVEAAVAAALALGRDAPADGARDAVLDLGQAGIRLSVVTWRRVGARAFPCLESSAEALPLGGARLDEELAAVARAAGGGAADPAAPGFAELKELAAAARGPLSRPVGPPGSGGRVEVGARGAREAIAAFVEAVAVAWPSLRAELRAARPDRILLTGGLCHLAPVRALFERGLAGPDAPPVVAAPRPVFAAGLGALRALVRSPVPRADAPLAVVLRGRGRVEARPVAPEGAALPGRFGPVPLTRVGASARLAVTSGERVLAADLPGDAAGGEAWIAWSFADGWTVELAGAAAPLVEADADEAARVREALAYDFAAAGRPLPLDLVVCFRATAGGAERGHRAVAAAAGELASAAAAAGADVRLRAIAVGDHPQGHLVPEFVTRAQPEWTGDPAALTAFVAERLAAPIDGIDAPEAYECALKEAAGLDWRPGATRLVVVLADVPPHVPEAPPYCAVDWRAEAERLREAGARLVPVHVTATALPPSLRREALAFLEGLAERTFALAGQEPPPELLDAVRAAAATRDLGPEARAVLERVAFAGA